MRRAIVVGVLLLGVLVVHEQGVSAQPKELTLQGVLRTAGGDPVNGQYDMLFGFYTSKGANQAVHEASVDGVIVENGVYTAAVELGDGSIAATYSELWLGITVGAEPEFPRNRLSSVVHALHAASAGGLSCTGCIEAEMLGFDPVTEAELTEGDLSVNGTVTATAFFGDGSGLTGITSPQGNCVDGWFIAGIAADGELICAEVGPTVTSVDGLTGGTIAGDVEIGGALTVNGAEACTDDGNCGETLAQLGCEADELAVYSGELWTCATLGELFDPSMLPADALNEISNNLLYNQFVDTYSNAGPVAIPDNNPLGIGDEIEVPDAGTAQTLTVTVDIANSDISELRVVVFDPDNVEYTLYNKGEEGEGLQATYPDPDVPVSGDLTTWVGENPQGTWRIQVFDTGFLDNDFDGQITSWSIQVQTLSNQQVKVAGDLIVDGNITSVGGNGISIDEAGNTAFSGHVVVGDDQGECTADIAGALRYDAEYGLEVCNGSHWHAANARPVVWRGFCSSHGTAADWNVYCLNSTIHNTAQKYLHIADNRVYFDIPGWYRVDFWVISNNGNYAHIRMYQNSSKIYESHEYVGNSWDDNTAQVVQPFQAGQSLHAEVYNHSGGSPYAYHRGYSDGQYGGLTVTYMGPLEP